MAARVPLLANDYITVCESPCPKEIFCYSPGLAMLRSGRLIATCDLGGPGVGNLPGPKTATGGFEVCNQSKIYTSDDHGCTWTHRADLPMLHGRPFQAGRAVYFLGHCGDLCIALSDDDGLSWTDPVTLTVGQQWHQSPCNVWYANRKLYLTMERLPDSDYRLSELAPVVMAANVTDDLTKRQSWTFSNEVRFCDIYNDRTLLGIPMYTPGVPIGGRQMIPMGWLESHIVAFDDPGHVWHDPAGRTFYLFIRSHTGRTNIACLLKVQEQADGQIVTSPVTAPSGETMLYTPFPGGHMKFHLLYDKPSELFWLVDSLSRDSMIRPDRLGDERFEMPHNERDVLALHFSRNAIDWQLAGVVTRGKSPRQARHYASVAIDGSDLHILSRSGDDRASSAHNGNLITFHTVNDFRSLVY
jgi:hypothetical protein